MSDTAAGMSARTPGLLCRATVVHDETTQHYCTLNTAPHKVHQCGDCGHVWTDSGEEFEAVVAKRDELLAEVERLRGVETKLRAWLADRSPSPESADLVNAVMIASGQKLNNPEAVAVLRAVLPMHETQHAVAWKQVAEQRTHFELEAFKLAEENAKLRAQLAAIGEIETQWGLNVPSWQLPGHRDDVTRYPDEQAARANARTVRRSGTEANVRQRLVGEWRVVDQETNGG